MFEKCFIQNLPYKEVYKGYFFSLSAIISLESEPKGSLLFNSNGIICVSEWLSRPLHKKRWGSFSSWAPPFFLPDLHTQAIDHLSKSSLMPKCWSGLFFFHYRSCFNKGLLQVLGIEMIDGLYVSAIGRRSISQYSITAGDLL